MALTQARLKELFEYTDDGSFVRRSTGKPISNKMNNGHRYIRVNVDGLVCSVHRCVFLYHHGYLPSTIDHIDNDRTNNKIENLRAATQQQNCLNRVKHKHSKSLYKNVYWNAATKKWAVVLTVERKRRYFGVYEDIEFADLVAQEARNKFHGKFVNHGGVF